MHPDFEKMLSEEESELFKPLFSSLKQPPVTSVRLNPSKRPESTPPWLKDADHVPWEPQGFYVDDRPLFTLDPLMHQGAYYVQEASSMIAGEVIRQISAKHKDRGFNVLDACAAPGGKTTAVLASLPRDSALIANEYDALRANILVENIYKWGNASVAVTRGDTRRFRKLHEVFDIIIADMPCSGEGMFRKDRRAVEQWSAHLVKDCALRQVEIAGNIIDSLSPGGYMMYSTCTFNTRENERNIEQLCEEFPLETVDLEFPDEWGIAKAVNSGIHAYRFFPHRLRGEGFFFSLLKKEGELRERSSVKPVKQVRTPADTWVDGLIMERNGDIINGMTPALYSLLKKTGKKISPWLSRGVAVAVIKGKDVIPEHPLSMSVHLNKNAFPKVNVNERVALDYLRRTPIVLPPDVDKGYVLLEFNGLPLGFVKNLGNRNNNLYPVEWRVRMGV